QSGSPASGTPESGLGILTSAQMARHYRIPFRGGGALTSSKAPDAQAAYESMMCMWPTEIGGVHFVLHATGWPESAMLASYEKWKQLLADYKDPGIDSGVDEQIKAFIEVRKDAILHARV